MPGGSAHGWYVRGVVSESRRGVYDVPDRLDRLRLCDPLNIRRNDGDVWWTVSGGAPVCRRLYYERGSRVPVDETTTRS